MGKVGSYNSNAKLTEADILTMRDRYINEKISQRALAKIYNISQTAVRAIVSGKTWEHVPMPEKTSNVEKSIRCAKGVPADIQLLAHLKMYEDKDCWEFQGSTCRGYGQLTANGKRYKAHRLAYELWKGEIPPGYEVCHMCDNRLCCNPDHLFVGTDQDNTDDMCNKHRQAVGEKQRCAKLTKEIVLAARKERQEHKTKYRTLANRYGVDTKTMWSAINGKNWKCADWEAL